MKILEKKNYILEKASWCISSNIEQFVEKLDLKIELVLFLYILSTVFL